MSAFPSVDFQAHDHGGVGQQHAAEHRVLPDVAFPRLRQDGWLRRLAKRTGGQYFRVKDTRDLPEVYASMPPSRRELLADLSMRIDALRRETLYQRESFAALEDTFLSNKETLRYIPSIWPVDMAITWCMQARSR